jgi:hypothetical protein
MKEPKSKYGKRFSEEFQRDAVRMLESGERTAKQLSRELGVSEWSLKRWAKFHGHSSNQGAGSRIGVRAGECEIAPRTGDGEPTTGRLFNLAALFLGAPIGPFCAGALSRMDSSVKIALRWDHTRGLSNGTVIGGLVGSKRFLA